MGQPSFGACCLAHANEEADRQTEEDTRRHPRCRGIFLLSFALDFVQNKGMEGGANNANGLCDRNSRTNGASEVLCNLIEGEEETAVMKN